MRQPKQVVRLLVFSTVLATLLSDGNSSGIPSLYAQGLPNPPIDRSGWVRVGSDSIFYEEVGVGPTIILIHDGLVHRKIWDAQLPVLSSDFRVVRYDRRGYGASPAPTEPFADVDDLSTLMDELGVERADLIAMSSGGRMAIDFTLEHPSRVHSLILVGAVVGGLPYTQHFFTRGGHLPGDLSLSERRAYYASEDPYEIHPANLAAKRRVAELVAAAPAQGHGSFPSTRPTRPALGRLHEIEAPTLILVGEYDMPDVHAHSGAINAGIVGSKRVIVFDAGHLIPIEQPESFNNAVLEFLHGNG
jgi:pimeloyl-ACP methyl ester carboxylesterase